MGYALFIKILIAILLYLIPLYFIFRQGTPMKTKVLGAVLVGLFTWIGYAIYLLVLRQDQASAPRWCNVDRKPRDR